MPEFTTENAFVVAVRPLGENTWILTLFTQDHGCHLGVIKKKRPPEIASFVHARWRARLSDQMGTYYIEETNALSARYLDDPMRLATLSSLCGLLDGLLPERQPYPELYDAVTDFCTHLDEENYLKNYVHFEWDMLTSLGFGLDTSACAGGGDANDLAYISPKSGRAVSQEMGAPYQDKMIPLPLFLWQDAPANIADIAAGLRLTGHFISTHASHRPLPAARQRLMGMVLGI